MMTTTIITVIMITTETINDYDDKIKVQTHSISASNALLCPII